MMMNIRRTLIYSRKAKVKYAGHFRHLVVEMSSRHSPETETVRRRWRPEAGTTERTLYAGDIG